MLSVCFREIISKTCHIQVKVPEDCIWQIVEKLLLPKTVSLTICLLVFYHLILHDFILVSSSLMAVSNLLLVFDVFRSQFGASLLLGLYPFHFSVLFQFPFFRQEKLSEIANNDNLSPILPLSLPMDFLCPFN